MNGYTFTATCPVCGDELDHQADGRPTTVRTSALAVCTICRRQWQITVTVEAVFSGPVERTPPGQVTCGTDGGYRRHLRNGLPPCDDCRRAHSAYNGRYKARASA